MALARRRGRPLPVRQGRRRSATCSPGAPRSSTATRRPARGQRGHARPVRGRPGRDDGRLVVVQGRPREPLRGLRRRAAGSSRTSPRRPLRAFIERPAGYLGEKADADTGWVFPVPDETVRPRPRRDDAPTSSSAFRDGVDAARDVPTTASSSTRSSTPPIARCGAGRWEAGRASAPGREPADVSVPRRRPALDRRGRPRSSSELADDPGRARSRQASQWCAEAIAADGLVHLFGTGHSRIPVEEMFPRYGSYPGLQPDRRAVDDVPHPGRRRERPAPGDVHRADARPGRGHPRQLRVRAERRA